jgi:hypothetical protein
MMEGGLKTIATPIYHEFKLTSLFARALGTIQAGISKASLALA